LFLSFFLSLSVSLSFFPFISLFVFSSLSFLFLNLSLFYLKLSRKCPNGPKLNQWSTKHAAKIADELREKCRSKRITIESLYNERSVGEVCFLPRTEKYNTSGRTACTSKHRAILA